MNDVTHIWVKRDHISETKIVTSSRSALDANQIRVRIDKFALTANNVSYAVSGDYIGYWKFFPAEGEWGNVPVWGFADVVESNSADIDIGERLYGYYPMASETILTVGKTRADSFMDATPHRQALPSLYNQYRRTQGEPDSLKSFEDERCIFLPLFGTSYTIYDYLMDNDVFGADQVIIGSVSSKTGFGLAKCLKSDTNFKGEVIGITSPHNLDFVRGLGCCDNALSYGDETTLDPAKRTTYVDMSGNSLLTRALHTHFGENLVESCMVGATHWEKMGDVKGLPGAKPTLFFAPAQISKRNKEWGVGVMMERATSVSLDLAAQIADQIVVERINVASDVTRIWTQLVEGKISPKRGIMATVK